MSRRCHGAQLSANSRGVPSPSNRATAQRSEIPRSQADANERKKKFKCQQKTFVNVFFKPTLADRLMQAPTQYKRQSEYPVVFLLVNKC